MYLNPPKLVLKTRCPVVVFDSPIEYFFNLRNLENDSKAVLAGIFTIRSIIFPFIALVFHLL